MENTILIVAPRGSVSTLVGEQVIAELSDLLTLAEHPEVEHIVVDLEKASFFGSSLIGAMSALWNRVRTRGGKIAICNVSGPGREVFEVTKLDTIWPICSSRKEALEKVAQ
jgi:stage II sporulation protein AA (anti-sigma F factor antagonist)